MMIIKYLNLGKTMACNDCEKIKKEMMDLAVEMYKVQQERDDEHLKAIKLEQENLLMRKEYDAAILILRKATESNGTLIYMAENLVLDANIEYEKVCKLEQEKENKKCKNCKFGFEILSNYKGKTLCKRTGTHRHLEWECGDFVMREEAKEEGNV